MRQSVKKPFKWFVTTFNTLKYCIIQKKILILHPYIVTLKTVVLLFPSDYKDTTFSEKLFLPLFWGGKL